jgi:inorganic pyrophosphatase
MNIAKIPAGKNVPEEINVVVEIPQGSSVKYEMNKEAGAIFVDRFNHTAMFYPFNYGFFPQTQAEDGDRLMFWLSQLSGCPGRCYSGPTDRHA